MAISCDRENMLQLRKIDLYYNAKSGTFHKKLYSIVVFNVVR